jgi:hypothetical protein
LGYNATALSQGKKEAIEWDTERLINAHAFLVGKSGAGKTHMLRSMINQISTASNNRVRVHVFDVHGDIEIDGASTVQFSEATPYGFNPLVVNPDPHFGGIRKRIQSFIAALKRAGYAPGTKQEAALRHLLSDLYAANGFYEDRPNSWRLNDGSGRQKKHPSMDDAVRYAEFKLRSMFLGSNSKTVEALDNLYKKQAQFYTKIKRLGRTVEPAELAELKENLKKDADKAVDFFKEHLETMQTGHELDDLIKYNNKDVMKSLVERLQNLRSTGIFRPERPPFDPHKSVHRYDIKALSAPEKKLFVAFLLEAIYLNASQRGPQNDVVELVVLDEAHMFLTDDPDNPINTIAKEARKFGLGLFCASQSPHHFSDDFLSNVSTKIILGIDQMFWDASVRKLKMRMEDLEWIVPHKKIIIQMNRRGETRNRFMFVATE